MTRIEKKLKLSDDKFKRRIGTTKPVFLIMLAVDVTEHPIEGDGHKRFLIGEYSQGGIPFLSPHCPNLPKLNTAL